MSPSHLLTTALTAMPSTVPGRGAATLAAGLAVAAWRSLRWVEVGGPGDGQPRPVLDAASPLPYAGRRRWRLVLLPAFGHLAVFMAVTYGSLVAGWAGCRAWLERPRTTTLRLLDPATGRPSRVPAGSVTAERDGGPAADAAVTYPSAGVVRVVWRRPCSVEYAHVEPGVTSWTYRLAALDERSPATVDVLLRP